MLLVAVEAQGAGQYRYRLHLDGKPGSEPVAWSERAQERRARFGIATDSLDLEISPEYIRRIEEEGLNIVARSRWLNTVVVMEPNGLAVADSVFEQLPFVEKVDIVTTHQRVTAPSRSLQATGSETDVEDCTSPLKQVNAFEPLYEADYRGAGMLVVIVDAGFNHVNEWDWMNRNVVGTRDMYEGMTGFSQIYMHDMHGACCLSIMATPLEHGICGTAQDADYFLIRTETDDSETELEEDMWVAAAELADSLGADVISSSLGYYDFDTNFNSHTYDDFCQNSTVVSQGAKIACEKGMLICNAAGNERQNSWRRLIFPADVEEVLTVGGVMQSGQLASFSSAGFTVPYVKPDIVGRSTHCYIVTSRGTVSSDGRGTSFATPLIAGLCTSLWSAVPELTPAQLRQVVRESASQYNAPDSLYGYGLPDFGVALAKARELYDMGVKEVRADAPRKARGVYNVMGQRNIGRPRRGLFVEGGRVWFGR
jgi:subtilisin family serine protease